MDTKNEDILASFELETNNEAPALKQDELQSETPVVEAQASVICEEKQSSFTKIRSTFFFFIRYITTSLCIFGILLVVANYSAYMNLAYGYFYSEELQATEYSIIESVKAANLSDTKENEKETNVETFKVLTDEKDDKKYVRGMHSISKLISQAHADNIDLGIEITPYENRIVIPKIGKNVPLLDVTQTHVSGSDELNDIFMKDLENGVIRYPGSAKPGEDGNSFIFGHSSNFPWMKGDYNDVFSLLDHVEFNDEVVVYYGQEKYTYRIFTKNVIKPGDVSVLKNDNKNRKKLTLMTCWPIGTTLNRLVLTGELISIE